MPPFGWQAVLGDWESAPAVTALTAVAAALYLWGAWRVARSHPARPWPWRRTAMFLGGLAVVVLAIQSGVGSYDDVLFWDHMVQHVMLLMIAPPLLVAGQPVTLLLHASRNPVHTWAKRAIRSRAATFLTWPPFSLAAYAAAIVGTHLTGLMNLILTNQVLHSLEHVLYLVVGYLFFLPLVGREPLRHRVSYPIRLLVLVLAMPIDTFTGLVLGYASKGFTVTGPRPAGAPSPVEDVHWGGAVMWIGGDTIMLGFMLIVFLMWSRDDRAATRDGGWLESARAANFEHVTASTAATGSAGSAASSAGIDDDEHLAAYNAYLARLNGPGHGPGPGR